MMIFIWLHAVNLNPISAISQNIRVGTYLGNLIQIEPPNPLSVPGPDIQDDALGQPEHRGDYWCDELFHDGAVDRPEACEPRIFDAGWGNESGELAGMEEGE